MTVNYSGNFFQALFRWRGSVWKSIWKELLVWLLIYYGLRICLFEFLTTENNKNTIKNVVLTFRRYTDALPVEFLLGFYITQVVTRWWAQVSALPWPDDSMAQVTSVLYENDNETKNRRRTVGRYMVSSFILGFRNVSTRISTQFPNLYTLQQTGLLNKEECDLIEKSGYPDLYYEMPLQWIHEVVRSKAESTQTSLMFSLNSVRSGIRNLTLYNTICFPLVYTQTVTVAVYGYFTFCLIGYQFYMDSVDTVIPFMVILRFIFNVGWLKVAEDLGKPFGSDDDDIELIYWLRRHIRTVFTISDYVFGKLPAPCGSDYTLIKTQLAFITNAINNNNNSAKFSAKLMFFLKMKLLRYKSSKETSENNPPVFPFTSENF